MQNECAAAVAAAAAAADEQCARVIVAGAIIPRLYVTSDAY